MSGFRKPIHRRWEWAAGGLALALLAALLLLLREDAPSPSSRVEAPPAPKHGHGSVDVVPHPASPEPPSGGKGAAPPPEMRRIARGIVFLGDSEPAGPGVRVTATLEKAPDREWARTTTDAEGAFFLECAVDGRGRPEGQAEGPEILPWTVLCITATSPDRNVPPAQRLLTWENTGPGTWMALHLVEGGNLTMRVVDGTGAPVPGGLARILTFKHVGEDPWTRETGLSTWYEGVGDGDGVATVDVRAGSFRAWARTPTGPFGESVSGAVVRGSAVDIGDVRAGTGSRSAVITVRDDGGDPVEGAGLTFDGVDDAIQGWISHPQGTGAASVHMVTGADGKARIPLPDGGVALLFGVAAKGFGGVAVTLEPTQDALQEYGVRLKRSPVCRVTLVAGPGGRPVPVGASLRVQRAGGAGAGPDDERLAEAGVETLCLGLATAPLLRSRAFAIHPVTLVEQACGGSTGVEPTGVPGVYSFHVRRPGKYVLRGRVDGNVAVHGPLDVADTAALQEFSVEVPEGREVRLRVILPGGEEGRGGPVQPGDLASCGLWVDDGELFPAGWSDSMDERRKIQKARMPLGTHEREPRAMEAIWAPYGRNRLVVGPEYRNGGVLVEEDLLRLAIPPGPDRPEVVIRLPAPREERCSTFLRARVRDRKGDALGAGVPVTLKGRFADGVGCPARVAPTGEDGVAVFVVGPGEFEVAISPEEMRPVPTRASVFPGEAVKEVDVPLVEGE